MTSPEGGFYSAEDADSEGVEGRFYVWTERQIRDALDDASAGLIIRRFNVSTDGNWDTRGEGDAGSNILHLKGGDAAGGRDRRDRAGAAAAVCRAREARPSP